MVLIFLKNRNYRDDRVADDHQPEAPGIITGHPPHVLGFFGFAAAVPGHEMFDHVRIADDESGKDYGFGYLFEHSDRDQVFEPEYLSHRDQKHQDHCQPGMNCARNEIRSENSAVPPGNDAQGEVPGNDAVNRNDERSGKGREKQVGGPVMSPGLAGPSQPSEKKPYILLLSRWCGPLWSPGPEAFPYTRKGNSR